MHGINLAMEVVSLKITSDDFFSEEDSAVQEGEGMYAYQGSSSTVLGATVSKYLSFIMLCIFVVILVVNKFYHTVGQQWYYHMTKL